VLLDEHIGVNHGPLAIGPRCCECRPIQNGSFSHERYPPSPSKTLRAAMGRSVRFAGHPGRTKERRVERLAGQHAKQTRRVEAEGEGK
jgi:hypothetical protein